MSRAHEENGKRAKAAARFIENVGITLLSFEKRRDTLEEEGVFLKGLSIKFDGVDDGDMFVVLRADTEEGPCVAFGSGPTFAEALRGTLERLYNRSIKWKADQYAGG